jgi:hypothetical protein
MGYAPKRRRPRPNAPCGTTRRDARQKLELVDAPDVVPLDVDEAAAV